MVEKKVRKFKPEILAIVGVTMYRALLPLLAPGRKAAKAVIDLGMQAETVHGAKIFVLPNPSGRNANFSYAEMLDAFKALKRAFRAPRRPRS